MRKKLASEFVTAVLMTSNLMTTQYACNNIIIHDSVWSYKFLSYMYTHTHWHRPLGSHPSSQRRLARFPTGNRETHDIMQPATRVSCITRVSYRYYCYTESNCSRKSFCVFRYDGRFPFCGVTGARASVTNDQTENLPTNRQKGPYWNSKECMKRYRRLAACRSSRVRAAYGPWEKYWWKSDERKLPSV